ncbi:hypothetical protein PIB30_047730 [Stylosanthes scabra]|uniref:GATA-type domain-containing protein n=1 Tax=Stylosanthes scabra TaxID=79078 RepID=A0ABU6WEX6_9FABA|nr:hypothetical protein [Stylosanthes scabra]
MAWDYRLDNTDDDYIDLFFNDVEKECNSRDHNNNSEVSRSESQLCIPTDRVEDLEWFPNFEDDLISLKSIEDFISQQQQQRSCYFSIDDENSNQSSESDDYFPAIRHQQQEINSKRCIKDDDDHENVLMDMNGSTRKKNFRTKLRKKPRNNLIFETKRCTHCDADETPQWRNGPMGPKTLCNACGVRYKSGRLLPEYRPKASPSFDSSKHSNYHRKIVRSRHDVEEGEKAADNGNVNCKLDVAEAGMALERTMAGSERASWPVITKILERMKEHKARS